MVCIVFFMMIRTSLYCLLRLIFLMVCIVFYGVNILNIHFCYFYFGNGKLYDKILKGEYFIFSLRNIDKSFDNIVCLGLILNR